MNLNLQCCTSKLISSVRRTFAPSSRVAALVVAREDDDAIPLNLKQNAVRKSAKDRLPDVPVDNRKRLRRVRNGGERRIYNMSEVLAEARYITLVPRLCIE